MATRRTRDKERVGPDDLGIDLANGSDAALFHWLVACRLFGARIRQEIAADAYRELDREGVLTPRKLADAGWQRLVDALGRGGYRRYDESTATELIELGRHVSDEYDGRLSRLGRDAGSRGAVSDRLQQIVGIGPTAARIFLEHAGPVWDL